MTWGLLKTTDAHEEDTTQTVEDIVSASLVSGTLWNVGVRLLGVWLDLGVYSPELQLWLWTKQVTILPSVEHYQSLRRRWDEPPRAGLGQITLHSSSPEQKVTYGQFYHLGQRVCQRYLLDIGFKNVKASYLRRYKGTRVRGLSIIWQFRTHLVATWAMSYMSKKMSVYKYMSIYTHRSRACRNYL